MREMQRRAGAGSVPPQTKNARTHSHLPWAGKVDAGWGDRFIAREPATAEIALGDMEASDIPIEVFDEADVRFHIALVRASGNEAMHLVMAALREPVGRHMLHVLRSRGEPRRTLERLVQEHEQIMRSRVEMESSPPSLSSNTSEASTPPRSLAAMVRIPSPREADTQPWLTAGARAGPPLHQRRLVEAASAASARASESARR